MGEDQSRRFLSGPPFCCGLGKVADTCFEIYLSILQLIYKVKDGNISYELLFIEFISVYFVLLDYPDTKITLIVIF